MPRALYVAGEPEDTSVAEEDSYPLGTRGPMIFPSVAVTRPPKISESVARDIVHDIVSEGLRTGDRLASEAVMLEQYGVSRESLREGLRLLEVQGLITIRRGPGGGPIVGRVDPANFGRISTLFYHLAGATYEELFDAWVATEAELAERAARNEDRALVRKAMEPFLELPDDEADDVTLEEFVFSHSQFHAVMASLAGNRVLQLMLQTIGQIVSHHVAANADPRESRADIEQDHVDVARAIASGRPAKARSRMEEHIALLTDFYKDQIGARMDEFIEWR
jgi:GntR family transcriptional regulator, transcriptional repressor for pyruvate dehydrogenase complex